MKLWKRLSSGLLAAALLAGLIGTAPAGAAGGAAFQDISDPVMANAAEVLRLLDVVEGTGTGAFRPDGTLTRAEFCKMTVEIMGRGDEEPAQRSRTIFTDVGSGHWARGYVNLASSITLGGKEGEGQTRLIMGVGDGTFRPDRPITYGEAVAILMRVLGYSNSDVASGSHWYDGYVALADSSGLSEGLHLDGGSNLTRGQAAILFYNLLFTKSKGGGEAYLKQLGGDITNDNVIILSTNAEAADGTSGSVRTTTGTYKTDHAEFSSELNGTRAKLVLDSGGKLLAILPDEDSSFRSVTVMGSCEANAIPVAGGDTVAATLNTKYYLSSGEESTYEKQWLNLRTGTSLVLCFSGSGQLEYIYQRSTSDAAKDTNVMVAKRAPTASANPFYQITGGSDYQIYKNGVPAGVSDLRQYDVGVYDSASKTLFVTDFKLSGLYENAYPNSVAPSVITMMGHEFPVLSCAVQDLSTFKVGDKVTLLLTASGQVAGAVSPSVAGSNLIGVAVMNGTKATVSMLDGSLTLTGETNYGDFTAPLYNGRLVTVSSNQKGYISLSQVQAKGTRDVMDLEHNTLGKRELSPGVRIFEQVDNGDMAEIERSDITITTIPAEKISYVGYDWAGRVDKVVLNDVTGDRYQYGMIYYQPAGTYEVRNEANTGNSGDSTISTEYRNGTIAVTNGNGSPALSCVVGTSVAGAQSARMGGIARSLERIGTGSVGSGGASAGDYRLAAFMPLNTLSGLRRSQFDLETMTLTTADMILPISKQVQIYNEASGSWQSTGGDGGTEEALRLALAFCDDLSVYYDRSPEEGGKVRILIIK